VPLCLHFLYMNTYRSLLTTIFKLGPADAACWLLSATAIAFRGYARISIPYGSRGDIAATHKAFRTRTPSFGTDGRRVWTERRDTLHV